MSIAVKQDQAIAHLDKQIIKQADHLGELQGALRRYTKRGENTEKLVRRIAVTHARIRSMHERKQRLQQGLGTNTDPLGLNTVTPSYYYTGSDPTADIALANVTKGTSK